MKYDLPANTPRSRRLGYTPVSDGLRGKLSGVLDHETILQNTNLSADAIFYALAILRRIHLWSTEKVIARDELIDELLTREQQGQSIDTIKQEMGSPGQARKIIFKTMRKRRPRWWQVMRKITLGISWVIMGVMALHLLTGIWFASVDRVNPTIDYLAKINAKAAAVPEADRAWPIYRNAILGSEIKASDIGQLASRYNGWEQLDPQKKSAAKSVVEQYAELIAKVRQGASLPGLGLVIPRRAAFTGADALVMENLSSAPLPDVTPTDALLWSDSQHPAHMFVMSSLAELVRYDMFVAADKGQMDRVLDDLRTTMGLARQTRELQVFMCQLVARSVATRGLNAISRIVETKADKFTDTQLLELRKLLADYDALTELAIKGNRYVLLDTLQRNYAPNGRIAGDGLFTKIAYGPGELHTNAFTTFLINVMCLPPMDLLLPSREDLKQKITQLQDDTASYRRLPLWEQLHTTSPYDKYQAKLDTNSYARIRNIFSFEWQLVINEHSFFSYGLLPQRDATDVAIALEQFRRAHEKYPHTLAALVPDYLSVLPVDHSTGQPLLYKLVDGKPLLYGRGLDNDDDGGVIVKSKNVSWYKVPEQGDWILYPQPADD